MTTFGYTLMTEEHGPRELVANAGRAEEVGFDFLVSSDHFHPWVPEQEHSPYAWSVLGAVATVTERVGLMTMVTCPILRYHPVVVAQKAATMGLLSDGRFTLGLGAGERLNEHVVGRGWPAASVRHEMLAEAIEIIRLLWDGGYVDHRGRYFTRRGRTGVRPARRGPSRSRWPPAGPSPSTSPPAAATGSSPPSRTPRWSPGSDRRTPAAAPRGTRSRCAGVPTPTRRSSGLTTRSAGRRSGGRCRPSCPTR